ncbi:MAG: hypothetical protein GY771_07200 [bacterium]|nr:hypothetical protein [bacterium]
MYADYPIRIYVCIDDSDDPNIEEQFAEARRLLPSEFPSVVFDFDSSEIHVFCRMTQDNIAEKVYFRLCQIIKDDSAVCCPEPNEQ